MGEFNLSFQRMVYAQRIGRGGSSLDATTAMRKFLDDAHAANAARKDINTEASIFETYVKQVLADSPLDYWRLNDAASPFVDSGSGAKNASTTGTITFAQAGAIFDQAPTGAAKFDGATGFAQTASYSPFDSIAACTIEGWVNHNGVAWSASHEMVCNPGVIGHYLSINNGQVFTSLKISGAQQTQGGSVAVPITGWHHVACTWASGDKIRVYVDGALAAASAATFAGTLDASAGNTVGIGCFNAPAASLFFNGFLDEVAIYSTQLSATRIASHYAGR